MAPSPATDVDVDVDAGVDERSAPPAPGRRSFSPAQLALLGLALVLVAGVAGWALAADRQPGRGSVDVGFLQDMAIHHEQALELSLLELDGGTDATVRAFAEEILIWQSYELGLIDAQLQEWGYSRVDRPERAMAWMGMDVAVDAMAGLASSDELEALGEARGAAADELFLQLMTDHHAGGVHMAAYAADEASDADVAELAARMARQQATEIAEFHTVAQRLGVELDPGSLALAVDPLSPEARG